jgi:hypothetical protein
MGIIENVPLPSGAEALLPRTSAAGVADARIEAGYPFWSAFGVDNHSVRGYSLKPNWA